MIECPYTLQRSTIDNPNCTHKEMPVKYTRTFRDVLFKNTCLYTFSMTFSAYQKNVGRNIQKARKQRELTQEKMAAFGFNYRYFQKLEGGKVNPTLKTLWELSKVLKCSISNFTKV